MALGSTSRGGSRHPARTPRQFAVDASLYWNHYMTTPSPLIRTMTEVDFGTVQRLAHEIWNAHYITIISQAQIDYMLRGRFTPENLRHYIDADDRWFDVLELDGEIVGYCSYAISRGEPSEMKLEQLYLLPACHGRGLGSTMLRHVETRARATGCKTLMLTVNKHNESAIRVYRRSGFQVREEVVMDIGNGFVMDDFVMAKAL